MNDIHLNCYLLPESNGTINGALVRHNRDDFYDFAFFLSELRARRSLLRLYPTRKPAASQ